MTERSGIVRADISQVLGEMRALKARAQNLPGAIEAAGPVDGEAATAVRGAEFQTLLSQAVDRVNAVQKQSSQLAESYQLGDPNVTLSQVVVASEKAGVAFEAMTEVRNRLVRAYEDIMKMPI